jgi:hypothetical protein
MSKKCGEGVGKTRVLAYGSCRSLPDEVRHAPGLSALTPLRRRRWAAHLSISYLIRDIIPYADSLVDCPVTYTVITRYVSANEQRANTLLRGSRHRASTWRTSLPKYTSFHLRSSHGSAAIVHTSLPTRRRCATRASSRLQRRRRKSHNLHHLRHIHPHALRPGLPTLLPP